jgi:AcrR family transcriptional regulator
MATTHKRKGKRRLPLTRERVLRAALELADRDGIESLSMRRLGLELGVKAMSLYNHVADKDDLLNGVADLVVGEIEVPPMGDDWKAAVRGRAISVRDMLARHPWAGSVILSRVNPSPAQTGYQDAVLGSLRQAGFSIGAAVNAFFTIDSYIYGFAMEERNLPAGTPEQLAGVAQMMLAALPAGKYPNVNEVIVEHMLKVGFDYADAFAFGLDLILDGLARIRNGG